MNPRQITKTIALLVFLASPAYGMRTMMPQVPHRYRTHGTDGMIAVRTFIKTSAIKVLPLQRQTFFPLAMPSYAPRPAQASRHHIRRRLIATALRVLPFVAHAAIGYRIAGGPLGLAPIGVAFACDRLERRRGQATFATVKPDDSPAMKFQMAEISQWKEKNGALQKELDVLRTGSEPKSEAALQIPVRTPEPEPTITAAQTDLLVPIMRAPTRRFRRMVTRVKHVLPLAAQVATGFAVAGPFGLGAVVVPRAFVTVCHHYARTLQKDEQKFQTRQNEIQLNQLKIENLELHKQLNQAKLAKLLIFLRDR